MMDLAQRLDEAVRSVCPIAGVSIGRADDKSTWRIDVLPEASDAQRAAAQAALDGFDPSAAAPPRLLSKLAIIDALSDQELATFLALRAGTAAVPLPPAAQIRLALRWDSATEIDRTEDEVRQAFAQVFGEARMQELLGS